MGPSRATRAPAYPSGMKRAAAAVLALAITRSAAAYTLVYEVTRGSGDAVRLTERDRPGGPVPALAVSPARLARWVEASAAAVAGFYGRLPVERVTIALTVVGRGGISGGVTNGGRRGARIDVNVGPGLNEAELRDDWVMTHELVHTAVPRLPDGAAWLDEGVATYVEPIARVRRGGVAPEMFWKWLVWGLPKGLPEQGDEGLDRTPTWGRTYWGGALFCFLADLELRERTANRVSLREALIGIVNAGGDVNEHWSLAQILSAADRATGLHVLTELHARMGSKPMDPDLPALFARLGVGVRGGRVSYDAGAPLATLRLRLPDGSTERP